jgi:hypothetical protein
MAGNPYRGEVFIHLDAKTRLPLKYTWDAIARIREQWPEQNFDLYDPDDLAEIISIGLAYGYPEWTPETIKKASPPIHPMIDAVNRAISLAMFGKEVREENPPKPGRETLWSRLSKLVPQWVSSRANSGA